MGLSEIVRAKSRVLARALAAVAFAACMAVGLESALSQTAAPVTLPMAKIGVAALISPSSAQTFYGAGTTSTDGLAGITGTTTPVPPEIWDLARALAPHPGSNGLDPNAPDRIYEYVHNNIAIDWMYGLHKGALGAMIDKSGTAFDQAALMVALLNEAGYSASYVSGTITLTGAQFTAWTGISNATAACQMLANGAIPAIVNGNTNMVCPSGSTITSVTMSHVWVSVNIPGSSCASTCLFDPAYKAFTWKSGIALNTAAQFTSGQVLSTATSGMTSGTISGSSVPYINGLNSVALDSLIAGYAQNLLNYIENPANTIPAGDQPPVNTNYPLQSAHYEDIIGGGVVIPYNFSPSNVIRQASLPYTAAQSEAWSCAASAGTLPATLCTVPDQYRTTLTVQGYMWDYMDGVPPGQFFGNVISGAYDTMFGQYCPPNMTCQPGETFFADQIYGRMLTVNTDWQTGSLNGNGQYSPTLSLQLDNQTIGPTYTDPPIDEGPSGAGGKEVFLSQRGNPGYMTLTASHPYAVAGNGTATTCSYRSAGCYMYASVTKEVGLLMPLTIVHAWGDTGPGLLDKWSTERATDKEVPITQASNCSGFNSQQDGDCTVDFPGSQGDFDREKMTANWLAQYTRAAHMHAQIAGSVVQLHHVLGVNYSDSVLAVQYPLGFDSGPSYTAADSFTRLDVDPAYSVTSMTASQSARNAAVLSIAALSSALEASVAGQADGLPDTASTAMRFEWGNAPPGNAGNWDTTTTPSNAYEDQAGGAARNFVQFTASNYSSASSVALVENKAIAAYQGASSESCTTCQVTLDQGEAQTWINSYAGEISTYAASSFTITTSQETFLGPGQRGGELTPNTSGTVILNYSHFPTKQRGPALVATLYDGSGNPIAIAHDVVSLQTGGTGYVATKGGGGGAEVNNGQSYDPSQAADVLKSQFVDKSNELGVNLSNGSIGYTAPAKIDVGSGGFPYELSADLELNSAPNGVVGPAPLTPPQPGFTTNWNTELSMSGSGMEAMGKSDVRAMVTTIATMMAVQDIYSSTPSMSNDVSAALALAWWSRQINGNVVTVKQGAKSEQFLETTPNNWIMPGDGFATLAVSGSRVPYEYICSPQHTAVPPYALNRGWNYVGMSFAVTSAHGDVQHYSYWTNNYALDDFDLCGLSQGFRLSSWTFPQGPAIALTYGPGHIDGLPSGNDGGFDLLQSVSNNLGRSILFNYDTAGNLAGFSNGLSGANLRSVTFGYNTGGTTASITDPAGDTTAITVPTGVSTLPVPVRPNSTILISQIFTADNPTQPNLEYDYDAEGHVMDVQDAVRLQQGGRNPYEFYVAAGTRGERDDPLGNAWTVDYDIYGHPYRYIDELGNETDTVADGRGRAEQYIYPEFDCEVFAYDDRNNTTSRLKVDKTSGCNPNAGVSHVISTLATWDPTWNKPLSITDGNGNITTFAYYASGATGASEIQTATRPSVTGGTPVYSFTYDGLGKLLTATDPVTASANITTTNSYDANEDLLSTVVDSGTGHLNLTSSMTYDAIGNVLTQTDARQNATANGETISFSYDGDRRKLETDNHAGTVAAGLISASRTLYDAIGRDIEDDVATAFSGTSVTTWTPVKLTTYTPTSKVATVTDGDGDKTTTTYDGDDRVNVVTDPIGRQTQSTYDADGHTLIETRGLGTSLQENYATYTYGADGEKLSVYDALGTSHTTSYAYDGFNRLLTTTFPDGSTEHVASYDADGNILSHVTRAGLTIGETYDALSRNITESLPATGSASADTITYAYDLGGRKTGYSDTQGHAIGLSNDTAGRLVATATTMPGLSGARTTAYQLDANGNRTKLTWPDGYAANYAYDALNRMATVSDTVQTSFLATYTYDDFSRRTNLAYANGASIAYSYTVAGDLLSLTNTLNGSASNNAYTITYTGAHELASETFSNSSYEYQPPIGTDNFGAANSLNQYPNVTLSGTSSTTLGYDGAGNLTTASGWTAGYDALNRLMGITNGGSVAAAYVYDPLGRRTEKSGTGVAQTFFLNDGSDEIAEYNASGTVLRRFVPGPAINEPVVYENCSGATAPNCTGSVSYEYFHTDHHGSVIAMSGASGASVEGPFTYDGFGGGAPLAGVPFKFVGMYLDAETGLYYDRARYYNTGYGRFLQTDPLGYKDDLDMYTYVGNDPTDKTDPTGTEAVDELQRIDPDFGGNPNNPDPPPDPVGNSIGAVTYVASFAGPEALGYGLGRLGWYAASRGITLPNFFIRGWYMKTISAIPSWTAKLGGTIAEQAERAFGMRAGVRDAARSMMNAADRAALEAAEPRGGTFGQLVDKYTSQGMTKEEAYKKIIQSSGRSNPAYNTPASKAVGALTKPTQGGGIGDVRACSGTMGDCNQ